jgi:hypothetical protein
VVVSYSRPVRTDASFTQQPDVALPIVMQNSYSPGCKQHINCMQLPTARPTAGTARDRFSHPGVLRLCKAASVLQVNSIRTQQSMQLRTQGRCKASNCHNIYSYNLQKLQRTQQSSCMYTAHAHYLRSPKTALHHLPQAQTHLAAVQKQANTSPAKRRMQARSRHVILQANSQNETERHACRPEGRTPTVPTRYWQSHPKTRCIIILCSAAYPAPASSQQSNRAHHQHHSTRSCGSVTWCEWMA